MIEENAQQSAAHYLTKQCLEHITEGEMLNYFERDKLVFENFSFFWYTAHTLNELI